MAEKRHYNRLLRNVFRFALASFLVASPLSSMKAESSVDPGTLSTRAMAVSGAYASIADDASAFMTNPAGISRHAEERKLFFGTRFYDGFKRWGLNAAVIDGITEDPLHWGFKFDTTRTQELQREFYSFATSYSFKNVVLLGINHHFDVFRETPLNQSKWLFALDAGVLIFASDFISFGAATTRFYRSKKDSSLAPFKYSAGASLNFRKFRAGAAVERNQSERRVVLKSGVEVQPVKFLMVRAGYFSDRTGNDRGYSLGMGVDPSERFRLDIAFLDHLKSSYKVFSGGFRLLI